MKHTGAVYIFIFFLLCSWGISADVRNMENEKPWHLLERAKIFMEKSEFGQALLHTDLACELNKKQVNIKYNYLFKALKPAQVKRAGDSIQDVYGVLQQREDNFACDILDEIFLNHPPEFFNKSMANLMTWLKSKEVFPEGDYIAGEIYKAEGEYEQAVAYYKKAWNFRHLLEIPDERFNIIYALADTSKLLGRNDEREQYLLLILTEDPIYGTTNLESETLRAMFNTIHKENTVDKFFKLYRHHNDIALKAYSELTSIYLEAGNFERAFTVSVLAVCIALTSLTDALEKNDFNYVYYDVRDLFIRSSKKPDILNWANRKDLWIVFLNFADTMKACGHMAQAEDMYRKMAECIPSFDCAKKAVYRLSLITGDKIATEYD